MGKKLKSVKTVWGAAIESSERACLIPYPELVATRYLRTQLCRSREALDAAIADSGTMIFREGDRTRYVGGLFDGVQPIQSAANGCWLYRDNKSMIDAAIESSSLDWFNGVDLLLRDKYGHFVAEDGQPVVDAKRIAGFKSIDAVEGHLREVHGRVSDGIALYRFSNPTSYAPNMIAFIGDRTKGCAYLDGDRWYPGKPPGKFPLFNLYPITQMSREPVWLSKSLECASLLCMSCLTTWIPFFELDHTDLTPLSGRTVNISQRFEVQIDAIRQALTSLTPPAVCNVVDDWEHAPVPLVVSRIRRIIDQYQRSPVG